jgi:hypothetical protein
VERLEGMRPLGRPMGRCADNIKMDLQDIEWGGRVWIDLAEYMGMWPAVLNAVINLWVPENARNFLTSWQLFLFCNFYFLQWPTNAHSNSYMLRHYRVILRELVINYLPICETS